MVDHLIDGIAGLDHQHHTPWFFQRGHELLDGMRALDLRALRFVGEKFVHFGYSAIKDRDLESMVVHIEDQILAHDRQAN